MRNKLQNLLASWPSGTVLTIRGLEDFGISRGLVNSYKTNGWVKSFGQGAFARSQDKIEWYGALQALQFQLDLPIHVGGKTALELQGLAHYLSLKRPTIDLLKTPQSVVPKWFVLHPWQERVRITGCSFLPPKLEIEEISMGSFNIRVSSRERAALELLYLAPRLYSFEEVRQLVESLGTLRAEVITELLMHCSSEKVKRLMLYFGEQFNMVWRKKLQAKVSIGSSFLKLVTRNGQYESKYNLFLPNEYVRESGEHIKF